MKTNDFAKNQLVSVGRGVKIKIAVNGEPQSWEVVEVGSSDIINGKISYDAPLIQCILGKKKGDRVVGNVAGRGVEVVVKDVCSA